MDPNTNTPTNLQSPITNSIQPIPPTQPIIQPPKKHNKLKIVLIILGIIVTLIILLIVAAILVVNSSTSGALKMSNEFVDSIQAKNVGAAYPQTSSEFQSIVSEDTFTSELDNLNQYITGDEKLIDKSIAGEVGTGTFAVFIYEIVRATGETHYLKVELKNSDGFWQVINFSTSANKPSAKLSSSTEVSEKTDQGIENRCFSISLPSTAPANLKLTDTSGEDFCSFIVQFEDLGDAPVAVGEVFSGDDTSEQKANFIPNQLQEGYELDLIDLGLLRTGKGSPMQIINTEDFTADNQKAIYYRHSSNRSISGQANSAMIETPETLKLGGKPTSSLLIWGVANDLNKDLMLDIIKTIQWKD